MDPSLPVANVRLMDDVVSSAHSRPRFLTILLTLFSFVAVCIAVIGIYGIIAYSVARRTREFGLRLALGAQVKDVMQLVMKQGAMMTAVGMGCGIVGAFLFTRLMTHVLYQVRATDPVTYVGVTVMLGAVALAACYIPAKRATRIDPAETLRHE
jgi:putative ABC transport system permease protein